MPCCPPTTAQKVLSRSSAAAPVVASTVHIHLHVGEVTRSVGFYRAFFGCEPVKLLAGYAKFLPVWAPVNLALSQGGAVHAGGAMSHLGIQLPTVAELQRQLLRVQAAGLDTRLEQGVECCHANQDKFWIMDPDGVAWEVYVLNHDIIEIGDACADGVPASACCPG